MTGARRLGFVGVCALSIVAFAAPARADEIWVVPTLQQDTGGLGIASNTVWPVTPFGAVRFAWSVPDNLQYFKYAKLVLIPHGAGGEGQVHVIVCPAKNNDPVVGPNCITPPGVAYPGPPNRLVEVDISGYIGPSVGAPGTGYLAVLAYTTPNIATDHIVGLRFEYEPKTPTGVATTTGANTFNGTQTAPAFVGDGSGLTNLPFPAGAATLGANTFSGTQTIAAGNLDLDTSTATTGNLTKSGGVRFLHDFGIANVFLGRGAGNFTMSGTENTAIGTRSLLNNTTGFSNTASGMNALVSNTEGSFNTAIGKDALSSNSTGIDNTANGQSALYSNTTGTRNTAFGTASLYSTTGSNNTAVGSSAGTFGTTGSNNIYLGANVFGWPGESNTIYLGFEGIHTKTLIAGIRGITTGAANAIPVVIDSNGQLGTVSSSIRFKEDVHDMADVSRRLLQLRPVTFRYTQAYRDGAKPIQYGLIAEEVAEVFPELAVRGADGQVETVHYETLNVLLLNELQKQQAHLDEQAREQQKQQAHLDEQSEKQQKQARRIEALEQKLDELLRKPVDR